MGAGEARTAQRRREWIVYPERHIGCWERMTVSVKLKDQQERVGGNRRNGGRSGRSREGEKKEMSSAAGSGTDGRPVDG